MFDFICLPFNITPENRTHVAVVYDTSVNAAFFFYNGVHDGSIFTGQVWVARANDVARTGCFIGGSSNQNNNYFSGSIADFGESSF